MEPNTDINEQNPGVANQPPADSAAQPQAPQASSNANPQTAQPATNQPTAATPQAQPRPKPSMFDLVLRNMDPAPKSYFDAQGNRVENPMPSKKSMTQHILAGAITSIIQGAQRGADAASRAPEGPAGTKGPANLAAIGAGAQAGQDVRQQIQNAPQQALDLQTIRKAQAFKNNLAELQNQVAMDKLHDESWSMKEQMYQRNQELSKPILASYEDSDRTLAPEQPSLFAARNLTHDDAMQKIQGSGGQLQAIQDGSVAQTAPDGRVYHLPTFSLVRANAMVDVRRDALTALAPYNSQIADLLAKNSDSSIPLSSSILLSLEKDAHQGIVAEGFVNNIRHGMGLDDVQGFNTAYRDNPRLHQQVDDLMGILGSLQTASTAHALYQLQQSGKAGEIFKLIGKSPDEISDFVNDKQNEEKKAAADAVADAKKKDADRPADPSRIQNAPALINSSTPYLTPAQRANYVSKLHAGMSNAELDKVQKEASDENDKGFEHIMRKQALDQAAAQKSDAAIAKGQKPVVGVDANGNQVLVPASDVKKYNLSQVREVGQAENEKVTNARSLLTVFNNNDSDDPGLLQLANKLNSEGKLAPAVTGFQKYIQGNSKYPLASVLANFNAGDPDVQRLFTKLGLSTTGLMQVHVGARGSAQMLEHFEDLAKAGQMSPNAFLAALDTENKYVKMKAMLPNSGKGTTQPTQPTQAPPASMLKEGVHTTFKNGQTWTLQNGAPVQVKQ